MKIIWKIEQLERRASDGFVSCVHWRANAEDGDYLATTYGSVSFNGETPAIPFESLTQEEVLKWVLENVDQEKIQMMLSQDIHFQKNPPIQTGLPW